jgi:hypothetical protein
MLVTLKARLETLIAAEPTKVYRNRTAPIKEAPALNVIDGPHTAQLDQTEFKMISLAATIRRLPHSPRSLQRFATNPRAGRSLAPEQLPVSTSRRP